MCIFVWALKPVASETLNSVPKDHNKDAACIAALNCDLQNVKFAETVYTIKHVS